MNTEHTPNKLTTHVLGVIGMQMTMLKTSVQV